MQNHLHKSSPACIIQYVKVKTPSLHSGLACKIQHLIKSRRRSLASWSSFLPSLSTRLLSLELLNVAVLPLAGDKGERNDTRDVHLGAKDLGVEAELLSSSLHVLETLLVVGAGTANPDLDLVLNEAGSKVAESPNDTLKGAGNVGEVGNTTADEENLALVGDRSAEHEVEDGSGVVVGLGLGGSTRVLTIVGKLVSKARRGNGISIDDGSTTTSNQGPDAAVGVEDSELQRSTSLGIEVGNISLLLGELTTERSRELHRGASIDADLVGTSSNVSQAESSGRACNGPLDTTLEVGRLVELGSEIEEVDFSRGLVSVGDDDQGVDLEVCELAVDVDGVKTHDEVNEDIVDTLRNLLEKGSSKLLV